QVSFVDMQAVSAIGAVSGSAHGLPGQRLGFGMVDALTPIMQGGPDAWAENAGIALDAVRYFAGSGSAPVFMNVWGLADEAAVASLIEGLDRHGFEPRDDERILGNGEPLAIDPSSRGIANPWRDQLGRAAFVAPAETTLIHATTPQAAAYLLDGDERLTDHP